MLLVGAPGTDAGEGIAYVFDDDATSREEIGSADLDARALPATAGEFALPVRAAGTLGQQTGALRLRIEDVP